MKSPRDYEIAMGYAQRLHTARTRQAKMRMKRLWWAHMIAAITGEPVQVPLDDDSAIAAQLRFEELVGIEVKPAGGGR